MKTEIITASLCCLVAPLGGSAAEREASRPNFVIINCDDMGYGDLSCFGNPTVRTPHLDRMAVEGQKWSSFYVSASVSSPSRAGLLTGRLGVRTGMYGDRRGVLHPDSPQGFPDDELTIADLLRRVGYHTACIGKWHLGHRPETMPLRHGFDRFYGSPFSNDMSHREQALRGNAKYPYEYVIYDQEKVVDRDPEQYDLTRRFTAAALDYIRDHRKSPFFLYLAHPMPHFPVYASEDFQGTSERGKYGDTIEELDWSVGQILRVLKEYGLDDNTLVLFTSDNGPWLPYKLEAGTAGPLRDGKNSHYEGGFRVPCIFWGGMVDPGQVTRMGSTLDLLPTLCEMAGVDLPQDRVYDGSSLLGVFRDSKAPSPRNTFFFYRGSRLYAVRKDRFKLHFMDRAAYGSKKVTVYEKPVLYDLGCDPEERFDVADKYPEVVEELSALAENHLASLTPRPSIFDMEN